MNHNNQILNHLQRVNYAVIIIDTVKFGPGRDAWQQSLGELTPEQRVTLIEKIERFEAKLLLPAFTH
jgi:hypothetical protein